MTAKKRIGRPPKAKEDRKAVNFTFRSRGEMRERLQAAAAASGRSISEEIERRLDWSFQQEDTAKLIAAAAERAIKSYHGMVMKELAKTSRWLPVEKPEGPMLSDLARLIPSQASSEQSADTPTESASASTDKEKDSK